MNLSTPTGTGLASHFIRQQIEADLERGVYRPRRWAGRPALTVSPHDPLDTKPVRTRFPPEPNGYLHFGHAKSICLNFGLARDYGGVCHLRFDDTNPEKEDQHYVDAIIDAVHWLGYSWQDSDSGEAHLYYASDYFADMIRCANALIERGLAYVDSQDVETIRQQRGNFTTMGRDSPYRNRSVADNLELFRRMQAGEFADGSHVLRAKIDMASSNLNLRDPVLYRIRHLPHHRTGDRYCVYPMYTFAHPIEDALENISHSLCTLEFEDQRPFYDWLLNALADAGLLQRPLPQQIEFARLNLTGVVLSKRKLLELVESAQVDGWDDPRLPTLIAARRRGYPAAGFRLFAERVGISKSDSLIDFALLEDCMRNVLNDEAERRIAVIDPLKLILVNYPSEQDETCEAPNHPQRPELGQRLLPFGRELWIERDDFHPDPPKGYHRLAPGRMARLRYAYVVRCTGADYDDSGRATTVYAECLSDTRSGTPGADSVKVKGNLHWLNAKTAQPALARFYGPLFVNDDEGEPVFNQASRQERAILVEPALSSAQAGTCVQFERHGYFALDGKDSSAHQRVFNRAVTLRDSWKA